MNFWKEEGGRYLWGSRPKWGMMIKNNVRRCLGTVRGNKDLQNPGLNDDERGHDEDSSKDYTNYNYISQEGQRTVELRN